MEAQPIGRLAKDFIDPEKAAAWPDYMTIINITAELSNTRNKTSRPSAMEVMQGSIMKRNHDRIADSGHQGQTKTAKKMAHNRSFTWRYALGDIVNTVVARLDSLTFTAGNPTVRFEVKVGLNQTDSDGHLESLKPQSVCAAFDDDNKSSVGFVFDANLDDNKGADGLTSQPGGGLVRGPISEEPEGAEAAGVAEEVKDVEAKQSKSSSKALTDKLAKKSSAKPARTRKDMKSAAVVIYSNSNVDQRTSKDLGSICFKSEAKLSVDVQWNVMVDSSGIINANNSADAIAVQLRDTGADDGRDKTIFVLVRHFPMTCWGAIRDAPNSVRLGTLGIGAIYAP
ncbi:hypothetical protein BDK51DRAFT_51142 [Blyttiomyces helicus]|uniref:Uncharacterized protein n=1 Tax=Blyttiomyces helicus TaxID=388810 RepID=A0A4P9WHT8_9FUNG|nr:hypothetical protein BDK51DRAFT_51142 [Blyttiomyces helicus]|eukprot:RKO90998.1 hypothetical protein BDK51DRAFT_51142 [Blyttiomyces helicus]